MIHRFVDLLEAVCSPPFTAYSGAARSGDPQVWRSCQDDAAGDATQITSFSGFPVDQCHNPVLSPDGTKILFETSDAGFRQIWVVNATPGSTATQLVADASNYVIHPAWGADSDTFVYSHFTGGALVSSAILKDTVSSPGSPVTLKSAVANVALFRPQFNFDGSRVGYLSIKDTSPVARELRVMDDDGTNDSLLDNTLLGYTANEPPQFGWANTINKIAYTDGQVARNVYVINDDGTGKTQIDANGDAAGVACLVSGFPFAPDDSFVVITGNLGLGRTSIIRAELDGSDTTTLGTTGASNTGSFRTAIVYNNRIWFISNVNPSTLRSMALDGTDEIENFRNSLGPGNLVDDFFAGDGFYFN